MAALKWLPSKAHLVISSICQRVKLNRDTDILLKRLLKLYFIICKWNAMPLIRIFLQVKEINRRRSALADPGDRQGEKNNPGNPD